MKYCPNCQKEFDSGTFCGDCGAKLIDAPNESGKDIRLGNGNAVSGGIHLSDSHNVSNVDQRVYNQSSSSHVVNNITQVERTKTDAEILQDKKIRFNDYVEKVFDDGILEQDEEQLLEKERLRIGLDETTAKLLIETARKSIPLRTRHTSLGGPAALMMNKIVRYMHANLLDMVRRQLPSLESLARNSLVDDVQYRYHLALAVLEPDKLISQYEKTLSDNYWRSYWACVAYMNEGRFERVVDISFELDRFTSYSSENDTLLSAYEALKEGDEDVARDYLGTVTGNYTEVLSGFYNALLLTLEPDKARDQGIQADDCKFYLSNLFVDRHKEVKKSSPAKESKPEKKQLPPEEDRSFIVGRYGRQRDEIFDKTVSRSHCRVTVFEDGMVEIENLSKSNGMAINGKKTEKAKASMDSMLKMGNYVVKICDLFPPRKTPSGPAKEITK